MVPTVQALLRTAIQMHSAALASALLAAGVTLEPHVEPMLPWVWKPPFALDDSAAAPQASPPYARPRRARPNSKALGS